VSSSQSLTRGRTNRWIDLMNEWLRLRSRFCLHGHLGTNVLGPLPSTREGPYHQAVGPARGVHEPPAIEGQLVIDPQNAANEPKDRRNKSTLRTLSLRTSASQPRNRANEPKNAQDRGDFADNIIEAVSAGQQPGDCVRLSSTTTEVGADFGPVCPTSTLLVMPVAASRPTRSRCLRARLFFWG
jgi:hypothetical protein